MGSCGGPLLGGNKYYNHSYPYLKSGSANPIASQIAAATKVDAEMQTKYKRKSACFRDNTCHRLHVIISSGRISPHHSAGEQGILK